MTLIIFKCSISAAAQGTGALGGRGDVLGLFNDVGFLFFVANFNWKFGPPDGVAPSL